MISILGANYIFPHSDAERCEIRQAFTFQMYKVWSESCNDDAITCSRALFPVISICLNL